MFIHKQMEIDRNFVKSSMLRCFSCFLGTKFAEYLMNKCGCLIKQVTQQAEDLRTLARQHKLVGAAQTHYDNAGGSRRGCPGLR